MIYINDKFIEMYAEMTKKFYDSINEENKKQKDMIEFINYLKELIERNHSLEKEKQELIEYLKGQIKLCKEAQQFALDNKIIQQVGDFNLRIATYEEILNKIEKR